MRTPITIVVLATCIVFSASAQKFRPGYYITAAGDTVRKDISIQKKNQAIDKIVTPEGLFLAPKDVIGFGIEGVNYIVRSVSVDKSPDLGVVTNTVFLEVMIRAQMSLYTMIDENEKAHFYIENENGIHELSVKLTRIQDLVQVQRLETYKGTLKGLFPTCSNLYPAIDKTVLSRRGMQAIFEKLYTCRYNEGPPKSKKEQDHAKTDFGILGGVSSTKLSFPGKNKGSIVPSLDFKDRGQDPTLGLFLETRFSRAGRFAARHELTYRQYDCTSEPDQSSPFATPILTGNVNVKYLKYAFLARVYFLKRYVRPFFDVGLSPAYATSIKHTLTRDGGPNSGVSPLFTDKLSKFELGFFAGIGTSFKSFSFEFRYENSTGLRPEETHSNVHTMYFNLSYRLIKGK